MLKKTVFVIALILIVSSCKKENGAITTQGGYVISLSINSANNKKVYLHKFNSYTSSIVDSITIINNEAQFKGVVDFPERYLITINTVFGGKLLIIENDSILIKVTKDNLVNSTITGSELNTELSAFQREIEKIYNKVDVLFPEIQRARLANDVDKLNAISKKMQAIEQESIEYNFNYAANNTDSFVAAMILNDLSKRDSINQERIIATFNGLTKKVKESSDSKELSDYIQSSYK